MKKEKAEDKKEKHKMKRNDWILIGGILAGAIVLLVVIQLVFFQEGTTAVVSLKGNVILKQSLAEDCRIPIQTEQGYNIFQIQDGVASIVEADCRDQICVEHVEISKRGETIVCLPHELVVEIQK